MSDATHKGKWVGTNAYIHGVPLIDKDGKAYIVTTEYNSRTDQFIDKRYEVEKDSICEVTP